MSVVSGAKLRVSFYTLGCKLNIAETGSITQMFVQRGYEIVSFESSADVVYINTCTVTKSADSNCRNVIRRARKYSPDATIVVTGCYAQLSSSEVASMLEVDIVLGVDQKEKIFELLEKIKNSGKKTTEIDVSDSSDKSFFQRGVSALDDGKTRTFLKVQDGCDYCCSYCVIPHARGKPRSLPLSQVLGEVNRVVKSGVKEVVLTGINLGEYRDGSNNLVTLISKIKDTDTGIKLQRLRISSIEPNKVTKDLLLALKDLPSFMDYFHLPLQSGDDEILKKMNRKYTTTDYLNVLEMIKKYFPSAGIGSDIIVGFPGECEREFENACNFIKSSPITHLHLFPYSRREGTVAAKMEIEAIKNKAAVSSEEKKKRMAILKTIAEKKINDFSLSMIGQKVTVLCENKKNRTGLYQGYTSNYLRALVSISNDKLNLANSIVEASVTKAKGNVLYVSYLQ
ncbi:MAG: tRNA (N(6)-L-threonylcarbamoyladenosine(37)-C(2))-methylthiotransferase MtaB [Oligoflexia bacterium]|nr:tRNA (N(6)-L-threonylcarbamoyladenosine(37)-C(2))-methylthiotransferase MtaB [Oligoflexia bacterium]